MAAVLDGIKKGSWSPTCILRRTKDRERYTELFLIEDARFYASPITIKPAAVAVPSGATFRIEPTWGIESMSSSPASD